MDSGPGQQLFAFLFYFTNIDDIVNKQYALQRLANIRFGASFAAKVTFSIFHASLDSFGREQEYERAFIHKISQRYIKGDMFTEKLGENCQEHLIFCRESCTDYGISRNKIWNIDTICLKTYKIIPSQTRLFPLSFSYEYY